MHENRIVRLATLFTFMLCAPASADNIDWSGFYLGGHVGALTGTTSFSNPYGAVALRRRCDDARFHGGRPAWL